MDADLEVLALHYSLCINHLQTMGSSLFKAVSVGVEAFVQERLCLEAMFLFGPAIFHLETSFGPSNIPQQSPVFK